MNPLQIIAGVIAGVVGAAIWAAISYYANVEIGYVAWGIGILVGMAVAIAGTNSPAAGVVAVLITIVSILGGKYAAVDIAARGVESEWSGSGLNGPSDITDEMLQGQLASALADEAGDDVEWPEYDEDDEDVPLSATYPKQIWADAGDALAENSDDEKDAMRKTYFEEYDAFVEMMKSQMGGEMRRSGFMASFGIFDLVFFGLAVATAWGIASREE